MHVNIFNGALTGDDFTDQLTSTIEKDYLVQGHTVSAWRLRDYTIAHCRGSLYCWTHTPGLCTIDDGAHEILRSALHSDLQVIITPVTFGGFSSEIGKVIDRGPGLFLPFLTMEDGATCLRARYDRYPPIRAIGILPEKDAFQEDIFKRLLKRFAKNLNAPENSVEFVYRPVSLVSVALPMSETRSLAL